MPLRRGVVILFSYIRSFAVDKESATAVPEISQLPNSLPSSPHLRLLLSATTAGKQ